MRSDLGLATARVSAVGDNEKKLPSNQEVGLKSDSSEPQFQRSSETEY